MQCKFTELTDYQWQFIENYFKGYQPRKHCLRNIMNAILWITRTGSQWRNLESRYPKWQSVYYYFRQWKIKGTLDKVLKKLVEIERIRLDRNLHPSAGAVDSQSVKIVAFTHEETGIDGGKKVNGRKRHILVDTLGLPIAIHVSAADISDAVGGYDLLHQTEHLEGKLKLIRADQAYADMFREAASWYGFEVEVTKRPNSQKGFVPQLGRWQVERSFSWMNFYRRLARDYERLPASAVAFIQLMFINIILARLA